MEVDRSDKNNDRKEEKEEKKKKQKTGIEYAKWPRDAPSMLESKVITIVCGNSRLHWALHEGIMNKFIPIMFWHTAHDDGDFNDNDDSDSETDSDDSNITDEKQEKPCETLELHIAGQARSLIFGDCENLGTIQNASETAARRDSPGFSVFVISSNPPLEKKIRTMFRDVPAKIFKIRNTDFFSPEQGCYTTMGVDRAAALYGAKVYYGSPVLVIDGGTAMTYSALDSRENIIGGGIGPGLAAKLKSLSDYTGTLPEINHQMFKSIVEEAMKSKKPIPFFAKDTETAMITSVCGELACQLRNIVKQFVTLTTKEIGTEGRKLPVIITGGDGKFLLDLLNNETSGIVSTEPGVSSLPKNVDVKGIMNIVHYALGDLLHRKTSEKPMTPDEKLQLKIMGLRIAYPSVDTKDAFSRGCIYRIQPESMIEGYSFYTRFDDGVVKILTLKQLYDGLVLYNEIGERHKDASPDKVDEEWVIEKKMWSKKVQEELGNRSGFIRTRTRELMPYVKKGELHKIFRIPNIRRTVKRRKTSTDDDPKKYLGTRIAKIFPIEDALIVKQASETVFFGTVKHISDPERGWFFIQYDDGDTEECGLEELFEGIDLYNQHKHNDTNPSKSNQPHGGLKRGNEELPVGVDDKIVYTCMSNLVTDSKANNLSEDSRMISEFKEDA